MINSGELYDAFREAVADVAKPYLWSDSEVWRYANDAYRMFVRLTGGIADFTSDATKLQIKAGESVVDLDRSILRIMDAHKVSDGGTIKIVNLTDTATLKTTDYKITRTLLQDNRPGTVRYLVIGRERNKGEWVMIPDADDVANLTIYRLPFKPIVDETHLLDEIEEDHHLPLIDWMKHLAYKKQDADAFDPAASERSRIEFEAYCARVRAEWERYKYKTGVVAYGGL